MSLTGLPLPQYEGMVPYFSFPAQLGELEFMLWLVVEGARPMAMAAAGSPVAIG
jgi:hypothetical protein